MTVRFASVCDCKRVVGRAVGTVVVGAMCLQSLAPAAWATPVSGSGPATGATPLAKAGPGPHAVLPAVTELAVPTLPASERAAVQARIAATATSSTAAPADAVLAAHFRKPLTPRFSMIGVTWDQGTEPADLTVSVRARTGRTWTGWTALDIDLDEGPSTTEESGARAGTNPAWVGSATGVEVAVYSASGAAPRRIDVDAIDPGTSQYDAIATRASASRTSARGAGPKAGGFPAVPTVITRAEWGADPRLGDKCWDPRFGDTFSMVFVHHTAGTNNYSRAESAAVVRGIYAYHTQSRGWCDIGYNFLVDRYGNIYEGRRGGIRMPVRGAHAGDYNQDTTGISLMGDFTATNPTRPMKHALVQLVAWRLGTAYHGAYGRPRINGARFSRISGHRDAMSTACPGQRVYEWLPTLRERVATRLGDRRTPIETQWRRLGGPKSRLGLVHIGEQGENGGHHTAFQTGRMYNSRADGMHVIYQSPILSKYLRLGETDSKLGYPKSNLRSVAGHTGSSAEFAGGRIFSSAATGATVLVRSHILKRYLRTGAATGPLGFPTVPVHPVDTGARAGFQHGTIAYDSSKHRTVVAYS